MKVIKVMPIKFLRNFIKPTLSNKRKETRIINGQFIETKMFFRKNSILNFKTSP